MSGNQSLTTNFFLNFSKNLDSDPMLDMSNTEAEPTQWLMKIVKLNIPFNIWSTLAKVTYLIPGLS